MKVVLDASAAYVLLVDARADDVVRGADEILAPDLVVPEVLNARWKVRRAGGSVPDLDVTLGLFARMRLVSSIDYAAEADALARAWDHPVYDCLYATVAKRANATLVTADARFAGKAKDITIEVIGRR